MLKNIIIAVFITLAFSISAFAQENILLVSKGSAWGDDGVTKIQALALTKKMKLESSESLEKLSIGKYKGVIYEHYEVTGLNIQKLHNFIEAGGNAILFYGPHWHKQNGLLGDLFEINIVKDNIISKKGSIKYPAESLPRALKGLKAGIILSDHLLLYLRTYLVTALDNVTKSKYKENTISIEYKIGKGKVLFLPTFSLNHPSTPDIDGSYRKYTNPIFNDRVFDQFDNKEACSRLLQWLNQ